MNKIKSFFTQRLQNSTLSIFEFRKVGFISPSIQVFVVILLWIASIYLGYQEFLSKGTFQGYLPREVFTLIHVPIWEEFIFRGLILASIWKYRSAFTAIVISSLLFGIRHYINLFCGSSLIDATDQVIYAAFIFAPVAGILTVKTKSVWPAVILHFINNLWILYF